MVKNLVLPGLCKTPVQAFFIVKQRPRVLGENIKEWLHRRLRLSINFKETSAEKNHYQKKADFKKFQWNVLNIMDIITINKKNVMSEQL